MKIESLAFSIILFLLPQGNYSSGTEYFPNGKMKSDGQYIDGAKAGKWREWYDENHNGRDVYFMESVGIFDHGRKDNFWMERRLKDDWPLNNYVPKDVPVWIEGYYEYGKREGLWKEYIMDGKPYYARQKNWDKRGKQSAQVNFVDGQIEGECIRNWWGGPKSDTLKQGSITETIINDSLNGRYENFYTESSKRHHLIRIESGNYENNKRTGMWTVYNEIRVKNMETMITKREQIFINDKPSGLPTVYMFGNGNWVITSENKVPGKR